MSGLWNSDLDNWAKLLTSLNTDYTFNPKSNARLTLRGRAEEQMREQHVKGERECETASRQLPLDK